MGKHLKQKSASVPKKRYEKQKKKNVAAKPAPPRKTFLDMIAPGVMKFNPDVYIRDNLYCCVWALKEYPAATEDQAILRHLGEKCGVNIRIYTRIVDAMEENRIIQNATNKNRLSRANTNDTKQMITAEGNLQDVFEMVNTMRKRREPLIHCAVFIELCAPTMQELERLQSEVISELLRSKLYSKTGGLLMSYFSTIYSDNSLPIRAKTVYMYLRDRSDKERKCWPGINTIAAELNCSRSTVKRALHDLEKHGYIRRLPRYRESGSRSSNLYVLVDD